MLGADEISNLKRERHSLGKKLGKIEKNQLPTVVRLSEKLEGLITEIAKIREMQNLFVI